MSPPRHKFHKYGRRQTSSRLISLLALAVLALGALGVVFVLPDKISESKKTSANTPAPELASRSETLPPQTNPAVLPERTETENPQRERSPASVNNAAEVPQANDSNAAVKREAESILGEALRRQARLENEGVRVWGMTSLKTSYPEVLTVFAKANENFDRQDFNAATEGFRKTVELFDQLAGSKGERFRLAMEAGAASLQNLKGPEASEQFRLALATKPDDEGAKAGLRRATVMPDVLARMDDARQYEATGDLDGALSSYRAAYALDNAFDGAEKNAKRVGELIKDRDFRESISKALAFLESGNFRAALKSVEEARKNRPGAPEILPLRRRIRKKQQLAAIEALRNQAASRESREEWGEVAKLYAKVLKIDSSIAFAVEGKSRAEKFENLFNQLALYLNNPDRLSSPEPLSHARKVLVSADALSNKSPKLREMGDRLRVLIAQMDRPRSVLLQSDGKTRVTVYRVARFGSFIERRLTLRPGLYTAVGSRAGYRDVRVEFRVSLSESETVVLVRCDERI